MPCMPCAPVAPVLPVAPVEPAAPVDPVAPVAPFGPAGPGFNEYKANGTLNNFVAPRSINPPPRSISVCKYFDVAAAQFILANTPLTTVPDPISTENKPNWLVVVVWVSRYSIVPVVLPDNMLNLKLTLVFDNIAPLLLLATAWYLKPCGCAIIELTFKINRVAKERKSKALLIIIFLLF